MQTYSRLSHYSCHAALVSQQLQLPPHICCPQGSVSQGTPNELSLTWRECGKLVAGKQGVPLGSALLLRI